jgi:hypothetical protein
MLSLTTMPQTKMEEVQDSPGSGQELVEGSCQHGDGSSGSDVTELMGWLVG